MSESFYRKEGLDFLYFARPGTAYGNPEAFGKTSQGMMGTATRSQFFAGAGSGVNSLKPIEMIKSKTTS